MAVFVCRSAASRLLRSSSTVRLYQVMLSRPQTVHHRVIIARKFSLTATVCHKPGRSIGGVEDIPLQESDEIREAGSQLFDLVGSGLGGPTPSGLTQTLLDFITTQCGLPWWLTIASVTVALRVLLFPIAVKMQKNGATLANLHPETKAIYNAMGQYKALGHKDKVQQEQTKLWNLYQKHDCNPIKMFLLPLLQVPVFITFFIALRGMARLPVESMQTGGLLWFTDLTVPDPYYALPLMAVGMFLSNVELGETQSVATNPTHKNLKLFLRLSSVLILPFTIHFPCALMSYFVLNSFLSTCQILILKVSSVRLALGIPPINPPPLQSTKPQQH